jgi:amino acid transporter
MGELKKVLKLRTIISTSTGMAIATSCYLAGIQVATILVGELAWISILLAGLLCLLSSMCFSELTSLYPTAAGIKLYIQHAFNERTSIIIGMFYVVLGIAMVGAESFLLASVLSGSFLVIDPFYDKLMWMIFFILLVGFINFRGVYITGLVQDIMTYLMVGFMIAVSIYTFATHDVNLSVAVQSTKFTFSNVIQAAGVGVFLYVGYEWVAPLAEETTDYRLIGKGMMWAIGLLSLTYALFIVAMYAGLTQEQLASGTPIPHIVFGTNLFGTAGTVTFIGMSILASVTSFNSGLLNTSRFSYAMGRDNVLPRMFSKLHPKYATPWVSIVFLGLFAIAISLATLLTGKYLFLILMAAALECFIYVVAAICVIRLRRKYPEKERAFKIPLGYTVPIFVILVFTGLMIGIFADVSRDYAGRELFQNYWVAVVMGAFLLLTALYALIVVPVLKKRAEERSRIRVKRRPGRPEAGPAQE